MSDLAQIIATIRDLFGGAREIPLHAPVFVGNEKKYLEECIDSTFVSSVGPFVDRFEKMMATLAGTKHAVAIVNGTEALHVAMLLAGVKRGDEVLTQPLTFVATCNAISFCGGVPAFVDVEDATLGMSPDALADFLAKNAERRADGCYNRTTGRRLAACVPVHIFGHPCRIDRLVGICAEWGIPVVEDAAESIGSTFHGKPTGGFGKVGAFSFNGNKTVTCGGGGAIVTDDEALAKRGKHLTTTAKRPHKWEYFHDEVGFNYRLPNLNAALACAQLECLSEFVAKKRRLASEYATHFAKLGVTFIKEPASSFSNYWLNAIALADRRERDEFLARSNEQGVMTRPCWTLMHQLPMYAACPRGPLPRAEALADRLVNIPSSVRP